MGIDQLSKEIIALQAQIEILEYLQKYKDADQHDMLCDLYTQINSLRDKYFNYERIETSETKGQEAETANSKDLGRPD